MLLVFLGMWPDENEIDKYKFDYFITDFSDCFLVPHNIILAHFYIVVYILDMTPCESVLLAKNGSSKLKQLVLITFLLLEYILNSR